MSKQSYSGIAGWIEERLPVISPADHFFNHYPTPKNLNYFWNFGAIAGMLLLIMIITGLMLAMQYQPNTELAFHSVERIMRDVQNGWLMRYVHLNGASFFFIAVYIHILRGIYYGSYKGKREILWILGIVIFLEMMATAFMGYSLVFGNMSLWGMKVITGLFTAIPVVGEQIQTLLLGGPSVGNATLNRFFVLHFLMPFVILATVMLHVVALHSVGSNNPLGIDMKGPQDTMAFHPYYTAEKLFVMGLFFFIFFLFVFFAPNSLGEVANYDPANPLSAPAHIAPEWYFLPFYAILRSIDFSLGVINAKQLGTLAMFASIILLALLPWLDRSPVKSARFRPIFRVMVWLLVISFVVLGFVGRQDPDAAFHMNFILFDIPVGLKTIVIGKIFTAIYFLFFLALPFVHLFEKTRPMPESIAHAMKNHA